jgi:hypothetical protein
MIRPANAYNAEIKVIVSNQIVCLPRLANRCAMSGCTSRIANKGRMLPTKAEKASVGHEMRLPKGWKWFKIPRRCVLSVSS